MVPIVLKRARWPRARQFELILHPAGEYQFTHTTRGPCDSCTPLRAHKGVPVTTFPKCALTSCQGPVSAKTPRVHARIPPGQPHSCSTQPITPTHTHPHHERARATDWRHTGNKLTVAAPPNLIRFKCGNPSPEGLESSRTSNGLKIEGCQASRRIPINHKFKDRDR